MLSQVVAAAIRLCSTANPEIAEKIAVEAVFNEVSPILALAVGIRESGLKPGNPMGVRGCYPKAKKEHHRTDDVCIRIGVVSLKKRLVGTKASLPSVESIHECSKTGNASMCRALATYNGSKHKYKYAKSVIAMAKVMYRILDVSFPSS